MSKWNDFLKQFFSDSVKGKIAIHLYNLDQQILTTNLTKEAQKLQVAPSTITKFLKNVGFNGWKEYLLYAQAAIKGTIKTQSKLSNLIYQKMQVMQWIEKTYQATITKLIQKIIDAKQIILIAHGASMGLFQLFKRALNMIGKTCSIGDMSDKYLDLPNHTNIIYLVVSISGKNEHINWIVEHFKHLNLASKYFISASNASFDVFDYNLNFKQTKIKLNRLESAIPVVQISFVQHIIDLIIINLLKTNKLNIDQRLLNIGILERIKKR